MKKIKRREFIRNSAAAGIAYSGFSDDLETERRQAVGDCFG